MGTALSEQSTGAESGSPTWSRLAFWGLHCWIVAYCIVLLGAFYIQFGVGELPCPLCMQQRYGMILSTLAAIFVVLQARRGQLTSLRYAQGLGMGVLAVTAGSAVSIRHITRHILPGDPGYGSPFLGLHLYTWAYITYAIVVIYCAVALMLAPRGIPVAPPPGSRARTVSTVIIWLFFALVIANFIAIIFEEGFAWRLPSDPQHWNLIEQLRGR